MTEINVEKTEICEVCGNPHLLTVLDLGNHPMCDDLIPFESDLKAPEYPITIIYCERCRTAHQKFQVPRSLLFPHTYHYRSRLTNDVLSGMKELVESCERKIGNLSGKKVLDIGCNDGSLLSIFREKGAVTFGIEPTEACDDADTDLHHIMKCFFDENSSILFSEKYGKPDIITFTNVFAHIENLPSLLNALKSIMHEQTVLVVENHYLGSVLATKQFDTFYHEHPRTYSYTSFTYIAESLGKKIKSFEFPNRYGGNIRVFISGENDVHTAQEEQYELILEKETSFGLSFSTLDKSINIWRRRKKEEILNEYKKHGKLRGKAFPGRAAILIKMLDLTEDHIEAIYEQPASPKIGHYVPGTRIPIYSDNDLFIESTSSQPIINFAWHINKEIEIYLRRNGFSGSIIPIMSESDFVAL